MSQRGKPDLKALFQEEAVALHAAMQASATEWVQGRTQAKSQLLVHLHTLKGSARTVGETALGQWAHDFESWLESLPAEAGSKTERLLQRALDQLAQRLDANTPQGAVPPEPKAAAAAQAATAQAAVRLSGESLQELMQANAQARAHLDAMTAWMETWAERLPADSVAELRQRHLGLTRGLNYSDSVLAGLRTVAISQLRQRVERSVRQLSEKLSKPASIEIESDVAEIDALLWERIQGSLEHLLANALDHGIESAALRQQRAKPEIAQLRLTCRQEGAQLLISLDDDGRGIDLQRVRQRALKQAIDIDGYSEQQLLQMVLLPGFSTAAELSQTSGRGVGLDAVSREIQSLGGRLELFSQPGVGTRFVMRLPLSLNRSQFMVLHLSGQRFALPLLSVHAQLQLRPEQLQHALSQDPPVLHDASGRYRCFPLAEVLEVPKAGHRPEHALICQSPDGPVAWLCDAAETGSQELTVEPLGSDIKAHPAIVGLSCVADDVLWVLDADRLWQSAVRSADGAGGD